MDPGIPVPPKQYGGHERLVSMFAEEYKRIGHEVTLLAGPESVAEKVIHFGKNDLNRSFFSKTKELIDVWLFLKKHHHQFDLIHNFGRLLYLLPVLNSEVKKIMTYGRDVTGFAINTITRLPNKNLTFTGCSDYCVSTGNSTGNWKTVYNAIEFSKYELKETVSVSAPLIFLGRIEKIKGPHTAIHVAKATGNSLLIAGNIAPEHVEYYNNEIKPHLGNDIVFLGPLDDRQKNEYLGKAKGLLFPIEWEEPFGMVMVEAMACGTPVIGIRRGSVNEVIDEGVTGFKVDTPEEMREKVGMLNLINRRVCRQQAEERFDVSVIAKNYLTL